MNFFHAFKAVVFFYLYQLLMCLSVPLWFLRWLYRGVKEPAYWKGLSERLGHTSSRASSSIWLHGASLGEVKSLYPLVLGLRKAGHSLCLTCVTAVAREWLEATYAGDPDVHLAYFPMDLAPCWFWRSKRWEVSKIVITENECWPGLLRYAQRHGWPLFWVSARLSQTSALRYRDWKSLFEPYWSAVRAFGISEEEMKERLFTLGVKDTQIHMMPALKQWHVFSPSQKLALQEGLEWKKTHLKNRWVWMASCTHEGEEVCILRAHEKLLESYPEALLILAPRHPARFAGVEALLPSGGYVSHSSRQVLCEKHVVYYVNALDVLPFYYAASDVVLMAGSLLPNIGGHSPVEAVAVGAMVITGPHVENNQGLFLGLKERGGCVMLEDEQITTLVKALSAYRESAVRAPIQEQAATWLTEQEDAAARYLSWLT